MAIATKTKSTPSTITRSKLSHQQALVAITEVILQHGNIDDLIPQLIETVQRVMQVDNVAILRLDASGTVLVMDTVRGPEAGGCEPGSGAGRSGCCRAHCGQRRAPDYPRFV